jgi:hypothetical protein
MVLHHIMEKTSCRAVVPARRNALLRLMTRAVTPAVMVFSVLQIHWPIRVFLVSSPVHHPDTPADDTSRYLTRGNVLENIGKIPAANFGSYLNHMKVIAKNGSFLIPPSSILRNIANDR